MRQPFFSVIIPSYNREFFLPKCITSVLEQTYGNLEIILVDDVSTDDTGKVVRSFGDGRINYIPLEEHLGVAGARNSALRRARGEYYAFLDSDDWWDKEKLEKAVVFINDFPSIKIFHTEEIWYRNGKLLRQLPKHRKPEGYVYPQALPLCCISISTAVVHHSVFEAAGHFDEEMEACEDYDFWLRATSRYEVKLIPEALTLKDGGRPDQLSSSVWGLDRFRIKALEKMLLSGSLSPEQRGLTLEELEKKCRIFASGCLKRGKPEEASLYLLLPEKYTNSQ